MIIQSLRTLLILMLMLAPLQAQTPDPGAAPPTNEPPPPPEVGLGQLLYVDGQTADQVSAGWLQVVAKRPGMGGSAFLGPTEKGWTGLAVKAMEKLPPEQSSVAAKELSAALKTGVIHLALTADGRAWYFFWDEGKLVDRYCSNPGRIGEVELDVVRSWQGRPELLIPVSRGTPLSKMRTEVSITDFNGFLYSYYPEMKTTRPASWRSSSDVMRLLTQVLGISQPTAPFANLTALPNWKRLL